MSNHDHFGVVQDLNPSGVVPDYPSIVVQDVSLGLVVQDVNLILSLGGHQLHQASLWAA